MKLDIFNKFSSKTFRVPGEKSIEEIRSSFSFTERGVFTVLVALLALSTLVMLYKVNKSFLVEVPDYGGNFTEGAVGFPRFINPLLSISDADRDMTALVFSGLLRPDPSGALTPDLAESFSISEDGLVYTTVLRENIEFHDGTKITTDDVEFTVQKAQDPVLKSPRRGDWEGVTIEKVNEREIRFILKQPYAPFLENLTLGILPKHIWKNVTSEEFSFNEKNTNPIGAGPYRVEKIRKNSSGTPSEYLLAPFKKYALGRPFISGIKMKFYPNEGELIEAVRDKKVDAAAGISPESVLSLGTEGFRIEKAALPRIFGVFFNQNQAKLFSLPEVRSALNAAVDRKSLIENVLFGFGSLIEGPLPLGEEAASGSLSEEERILAAKEILERNGWAVSSTTGIYEKKTKTDAYTLSFGMATGDAPELQAAAKILKGQWEKIGASVSLEIYETGDLNQNIIRPRRYDSIFFGEVIGRDLDLYPFWHSSQRNDPGLNIALYANITADKLLEEARVANDTTIRDEKLAAFAEEVKKDAPAVFLYSPDFLYILPEKVKGMALSNLSVPSERFMSVHKWFVETNKVWTLFVKNN